jgi:DNA-binding IclR family transcriptional regulator
VPDYFVFWDEIVGRLRIHRADCEACKYGGEMHERLSNQGGALAAPIKDFGGKTIAVLDILTPEHRYTDEHRRRCIAILLEETQRA